MHLGRRRVLSYRAFVIVVMITSVTMLYQSTCVFKEDKDVMPREGIRSALSVNTQHKDGHLDIAKSERPRTQKIKIPTESGPCYKQIQIWTSHSRGGNGSMTLCPGLPCGVHLIEDTSLKTLEESDAVFFDPLSKWDWDKIHARKRPGQVWMTGTGESPINTRKHIIPPKKYLNNTYEYMISYRHHPRTIYGDYGNFNRSRPSVNKDKPRNWANGKKRLAVWVAKNCPRNKIYLQWNRTEFVRALSKVIQVDMYGACGDEECPRYTKTCHDKIASHKFYLAFENCKCRNYITEKVWSNSFEYNLVPVVYGPSKEDYELVLPPNSFIFLEDFKNVKHFTDYLILLNKRDDLYNRYHEWRKLGTAEYTPAHLSLRPQGMCRVVQRMLEDEKAKATGTYKPLPPFDWDSWWLGSCNATKDFPI